MQYALKNRMEVDNFIVLTDNETWCGREHPHQALEKYRQKMGRNAKLIVAGLRSTGFSIANPDDEGMLDIVGFDSSAPDIIRNFVMD